MKTFLPSALAVLTLPGRILGGTLLLGLSGMFGFFGVCMSRDTFKKMTQWHVAHGIVVGCEEHGSGTKTTYRREVEFQPPHGEKVVFTEFTGFGTRPSVGGRVKVRYAPDNPAQADVPTLGGFWFAPLICLFFGAGFLIMSIVFYAGLA